MGAPKIPRWKAQALYHIVHDFDRFCQHHKIEYWAEGGTLIGVIRHGGIIPWDDDVDVQMTTDSYKRLQKMEAALYEYDLAIAYEEGFGNLMKIVRPNEPVISASKPWSFPFIDVFRMKKKGNDLIYAMKIWRDEVRGGRIPIKDLFPLKRAKFGKYEINVPNKSKAYLINNYGPDVLTTAYFEGFHTDDQPDTHEAGQKLKLTRFTPARPFYTAPNDSKRVSKTTPGGIPKVIHQIWLGGTPTPSHALYMSTWANMPGWEYKLWDNSTLNRKNFPITWPYILKAMQEGKKLGDVKKRFAQVGDLMRLEILYRHGGIYLDANIERIKDIGPLFRSPKVQMAVSNENPCGFQCYGNRGMRYISNSFIASTPKNPNLKLMLNKKTLDKINFKNKHVNEETGPYFLGRHLFKENGVTMIPTPLVYPFDPGSSGKCFSKGKSLRGANIVLKQPGGSKTYMQFPCKAYPNAYAMKSWQSGGSWW